ATASGETDRIEAELKHPCARAISIAVNDLTGVVAHEIGGVKLDVNHRLISERAVCACVSKWNGRTNGARPDGKDDGVGSRQRAEADAVAEADGVAGIRRSTQGRAADQIGQVRPAGRKIHARRG